MSARSRESVPGDGQVAAADGACRRPCGVLVRRRADGIGAADRGRRAVEVDLGAAHRPLTVVVLGQQRDEVATIPEVAAPDAVAVARPVPHVEQERHAGLAVREGQARAGLVEDGGDGAARRPEKMGLPAGVDDDLVVAVLLGVDEQRPALKGAGARYCCLTVALGGADADDEIGHPQRGGLSVDIADVLACRARRWPTGPAPRVRDCALRDDHTERRDRDGHKGTQRHEDGTVWFHRWSPGPGADKVSNGRPLDDSMTPATPSTCRGCEPPRPGPVFPGNPRDRHSAA